MCSKLKLNEAIGRQKGEKYSAVLLQADDDNDDNKSGERVKATINYDIPKKNTTNPGTKIF